MNLTRKKNNTTIRPVLKKMGENIDIILKNNGDAEKLLEATEELKKSCEEFKKNAKKLRRDCTKRWVFMKNAIGGVIGCSLGVCCGLVVGGPSCSVPILLFEGGQIFVTSTMGFSIGSHLGYRDSDVKMWTHYKDVKVMK